MNIRKKFEKFWSGGVSFNAIETFPTLDAAVKASVPSNAAKIIIDEKTLSYDFKRIKEVENPNATTNTLRGSKSEDPGKRKGEKVFERKDKQVKDKE